MPASITNRTSAVTYQANSAPSPVITNAIHTKWRVPVVA